MTEFFRDPVSEHVRRAVAQDALNRLNAAGGAKAVPIQFFDLVPVRAAGLIPANVIAGLAKAAQRQPLTDKEAAAATLYLGFVNAFRSTMISQGMLVSILGPQPTDQAALMEWGRQAQMLRSAIPFAVNKFMRGERLSGAEQYNLARFREALVSPRLYATPQVAPTVTKLAPLQLAPQQLTTATQPMTVRLPTAPEAPATAPTLAPPEEPTLAPPPPPAEEQPFVPPGGFAYPSAPPSEPPPPPPPPGGELMPPPPGEGYWPPPPGEGYWPPPPGELAPEEFAPPIVPALEEAKKIPAWMIAAGVLAAFVLLRKR